MGPTHSRIQGLLIDRELAEDKLRGMTQPLWWLWLGTLINRAGTFISPFFMLYLTRPCFVESLDVANHIVSDMTSDTRFSEVSEIA